MLKLIPSLKLLIVSVGSLKSLVIEKGKVVKLEL